MIEYVLKGKSQAELYEFYGRAVETFRGRLQKLLELFNDDTLAVLTADHGEMLGEQGRIIHGGPLTQELQQVPLSFHHTCFSHKHHSDIIQETNILPMILNCFNIPHHLPCHMNVCQA